MKEFHELNVWQKAHYLTLAVYQMTTTFPREEGIQCSEVQEARWGSITKIRLPGGSEVGLYQPRHPFALALTANWQQL